MSEGPVLFITEGDPWGNPTGGQTTFARHMLSLYREKLAISSYCSDKSLPTGRWIKRSFEGSSIWYFSRGYQVKYNSRKPLIPLRIKAYFNSKRYMPSIINKEHHGVFIDSPEILFAAAQFSLDKLCYRFAGVNNPVANSRYILFRSLGKVFEHHHISVLRRMKPELMLASADFDAINEFHERTNHKLENQHFRQFPTRVDTDIFYPIDKHVARKQLDLPSDSQIFVTVGRLSWIKGWDLLLDSFTVIRMNLPSAVLIFVGDGEDHGILERKAEELKIRESIVITGSIPQAKVVKYINSADVCLVGSVREGWSLAMCEMIACGKAIVSTDVSGARDMIIEGENGYVVTDRDPDTFAAKVLKALKLSEAYDVSLKIADRYSVRNMKKELNFLWKTINNGH